MDALISFLNSLDQLNLFLPLIAKLAVVVLICLIAFIPISLLAWTISKAFTPTLTNLTGNLERFSAYFFNLSEKININITETLEQFYKTYDTVVAFDSDTIKLTGHPVQTAIDNFETDLAAAPALATDREAHKTSLVEQLNTTLDGLGAGIQSVDNIEIPQLKLKQ